MLEQEYGRVVGGSEQQWVPVIFSSHPCLQCFSRWPAITAGSCGPWSRRSRSVQYWGLAWEAVSSAWSLGIWQLAFEHLAAACSEWWLRGLPACQSICRDKMAEEDMGRVSSPSQFWAVLDISNDDSLLARHDQLDTGRAW